VEICDIEKYIHKCLQPGKSLVFFLNRWKPAWIEWRYVAAGEAECNSSHQVSRNAKHS